MRRSTVKIFKKFLHTNSECKRIGIIGVPFDKGQTKIGVGNGPNAIRSAGLLDKLNELKLDVKDFGNITYSISKELENQSIENMKSYAHIAACNYQVSKAVEQILLNNRVCVTLGGDHSLGLGTVDGHIKAKKDICVLWVDAHADLNTNKTSSSGNVHGMPLALLAEELSDYWPYLPGMDWQKPIMSLKNLAYIGLRSVDTYERLIIEKLGINAFGMEDIEKYGINTIFDMAMSKIDPHNDKSIHVSFDIDSLDSLEAPSTGTAVRGGLTLREGIQLMELVQNTQRLNAIDLVEVNPSIGSENDVKRTVDAAIHILMAALGYSRRGFKSNGINTLPLQTFPPTRQIL